MRGRGRRGGGPRVRAGTQRLGDKPGGIVGSRQAFLILILILIGNSQYGTSA